MAAVPAPGRPPPAAAEAGGERCEAELRWRLSPHARRLATLGLAGLVIALISGRPEFAGVAAPALLLLAARRAAQPARIAVRVRLGAARSYEGEECTLDVEVTGQGDHDVELMLRPGEAIEPTAATSVTGSRARFAFTSSYWGRRHPGALELVLRDRWRLTEGRAVTAAPAFDCYPRPAQQRTTVVLSRLPNRLGEHPARVPGEGIEFAGVREYVPGDRQRRINWPASLRRGRLQVNTFAAERSQDVVLLLDATSDVGEPGATALDLALRGATATARAYLAARDRVGFVAYQWGGVQWLPPSLGQRQVYRIIDAMLAGQRGSRAGDRLHRLPRAALPPGALIVAFSPLLDHRFVEALRDLRERSFAVLIVDVLNAEPRHGRTAADHMTRRIWRLEQDAVRFSLRELGIPVVHWDGEQSLDLPLAPYTRRVMVAHR
jgi:uncharacterized protein (DUF58 family)